MIDIAYVLERFIYVFGINPNTKLIVKISKELILISARAV